MAVFHERLSHVLRQKCGDPPLFLMAKEARNSSISSRSAVGKSGAQPDSRSGPTKIAMRYSCMSMVFFGEATEEFYARVVGMFLKRGTGFWREPAFLLSLPSGVLNFDLNVGV
jgi:hypothetical protein